MKPSVSDAAQQLERRNLLKRFRPSDHLEKCIAYVSQLVGQELPQDLRDFYRERVAGIGDYSALQPEWNDWVGWGDQGDSFTQYLSLGAVRIFSDACGNDYVLDLNSGPDTPAVYFVDHEREPELGYAAGSSLAACMLLIGESERAFFANERQPDRWELTIDPDIDNCPRARAIWNAG